MMLRHSRSAKDDRIISVLDNLLKELFSEGFYPGMANIPDDLTGKQDLFRSLINIRPPVSASDELLELQDEYLGWLAFEKGIVSPAQIPALPAHQRIKLWKGDITCLSADAIVNAANSRMLGCFLPLHRCIDNAVHSAAGIGLRLECDRMMRKQGHPEPTGSAKITGGYNLPARHVIHTVGPVIYGDLVTPGDDELLASCYRSCLELAERSSLASLAFCCISTGEFRFPASRAAAIAVKTVKDFLNERTDAGIETVIFNVFTDSDLMIYKQLLEVENNE